MDYTKDDLRKVFEDILRDIDNDGGKLGAKEARELANKGVPIIKIALENIPREALKAGFDKWLNSL